MAVKRLFWDLETSPNIMFSWRAGFKINLDPDNIIRERGIICACYKWQGRDEVGHLEWNNGNDTELLETLSVILSAADELVAHNGDKFDLKWFNTRNLINELPPIPAYKTVDTLKLARKKFYLNSNKLDYLAKILLGEGKIKTEFDLWKNIVLNNDIDSMSEMVRYCQRDVVLLERVWEKLAKYDEPNTHAGVTDGKPRWSCPHCATLRVIKSKNRISKKGIKSHQMHCKQCGAYYQVSGLVFKKYIEDKRLERQLEKEAA